MRHKLFDNMILAIIILSSLKLVVDTYFHAGTSNSSSQADYVIYSFLHFISI